MDRRAVADAIIAVENLVKSLSTVGSVSLRLADMSVGSAHVVISGNNESAIEVVEYLQGGLRQLEVMAETPARWHRDALRAVVALGEAANRRGVEAVKLGVDTVIERIDALSARTPRQHLKRNLDRSAGLVSCIATRMTLRENVAQRAYATSARAKPWTCFSVLTASQIKAHLEEQVAVWGDVERDADGRLIRVNVEGIERISTDGPTSARKARGILGSDWTNGTDPLIGYGTNVTRPPNRVAGSCPRPGVNDDGRRFLRDRPKSTKEGLRPCLFEYRPLRRFAAGSMPCLMVRGIWSRCLRRSPGWARS